MKSNLKYLGVLLSLIGVVILAVYHFSGSTSNAMLICAAICVIFGPVVYGLLAKYAKD
jgi:multisubunit Na+/H+ antiporter MnhG subunit